VPHTSAAHELDVDLEAIDKLVHYMRRYRMLKNSDIIVYIPGDLYSSESILGLRSPIKIFPLPYVNLFEKGIQRMMKPDWLQGLLAPSAGLTDEELTVADDDLDVREEK
jgi:hypothetical protein